MKKVIFIFLILFLVISCKNKFDKEKWMKNNNDASNNPRFEMVNDLKKNYLCVGKTTLIDIDSLLGKPYSQFKDTFHKTTEYKYEIGSNPGFHIDPWYLTLYFDSTETLRDMETARN
jgi:hypothetical protein